MLAAVCGVTTAFVWALVAPGRMPELEQNKQPYWQYPEVQSEGQSAAAAYTNVNVGVAISGEESAVGTVKLVHCT